MSDVFVPVCGHTATYNIATNEIFIFGGVDKEGESKLYSISLEDYKIKLINAEGIYL